MQDGRKRPRSEETKQKIREATLGKKKKISKPNISWFKKGKISHNKLSDQEKIERRQKKRQEVLAKRKAKEYSKTRRSAKGRAWSLQVKERDGYKCQKCGTSDHLHAHHIVKWNDKEDLRFELSNGITYCRKCHKSIETKGTIPWNKGKKSLKSPWNKGLKGITKAWNKGKPMSLVAVERLKKSPKSFKKGHKPWNSGKPADMALIRKMVEARKGKAWNSGKKLSEEHRLKCVETLRKARLMRTKI